MGQTFALDVSRWVEKTGLRMDVVVRKVALDVHRSVVLATPVDTGHARGNWQVAINLAPDAELNVKDPTGAATIAKGATVLATLKAGDVAWIANNVAYILPLEYGHSKQAPAGMARITVARFRAMFSKAVGEAARSTQ